MNTFATFPIKLVRWRFFLAFPIFRLFNDFSGVNEMVKAIFISYTFLEIISIRYSEFKIENYSGFLHVLTLLTRFCEA